MNADFLQHCLTILNDLPLVNNSWDISVIVFEQNGDEATFRRDSNGAWALAL